MALLLWKFLREAPWVVGQITADEKEYNKQLALADNLYLESKLKSRSCRKFYKLVPMLCVNNYGKQRNKLESV